MWTIGYINNIINDTIYLTYTHVDYNIPYVFSNIQQFRIKDIVAIKLEEKIIHGLAYYNVIAIYKLSQLDSSIKIHTFYEYQKYLINIANNKFDTDGFYKKISNIRISKILSNHLNDIFNSNFEFLNYYISSLDITKLVTSRKVNVVEYEYDKNGDYSYRCRIECTDYHDSYINSFLYINGSYSSTCINNTPAQLPNETYQQAVDRIIKETANRILSQYSKEKHFQHLLCECKQIQSLYETEKQTILELVKNYLRY